MSVQTMRKLDKDASDGLRCSGSPAQTGLASFIFACAGLALAAGLFIPAIFATPTPNIAHPRLGFLYLQYNPDAPVFFYSALDFPNIYRKINDRASRPLFSLITRPCAAGLAWAVETAAPHSRLARVRWGGKLAVEHLCVYYGWIAANTALLVALLWLMTAEMLRWLQPADARIGLLLFSLTPPVLLSVTQLHTNIAGWAIIAASVSWWFRVIDGRRAWPLALLLGILLLGKMHVTLLLLGAAFFWRGQRWREMLLCGALIAGPTLAWRAYCAHAGIDSGVWELQAAAASLMHASPGQLAQRSLLFLVEQLIGMLLLFSPAALFYMMRGAFRAAWRSRLCICAAIAAGIEIAAMLALQRAGAVYLYGLFFLALPLLFAGMAPARSDAPVPGGARCGGSCRRTLLIAQLLWLPAALYAQLWLWRHNWWF